MMSKIIAWVKLYRFYVGLGLASLVVLVASSTLTYRLLDQPAAAFQPAAAIPEPQTDLDLSSEDTDLKTLNVLLLGYGGAGHDGGFLSDIIQVVHVNFDAKKISLISIPRDLWVELPNGKQSKINQALTLGNDRDEPLNGGLQVSKEMASVVTGLPIHYAIGVDFVGFKRIVGQELDGIEVEVTETLNDPWYPIKGEEQNVCGMSIEELAEVHQKYSGFELERQFECRYEQIHFEPGLVEMEGHQALAFARSRHGSAGGDFSRSQRQHQLLKAILKKLLSLQALQNAPQLLEDMETHVATDIDLSIVEKLLPALQNVGQYQHSSVVISTENVLTSSKSRDGQFILIPKDGVSQWPAAHKFVSDQIN